MGLLDMTNDPESMGLLNAGLSMMGNSGPSLMPHSLGQIIAGGGQAGLQAMQQAKMQKQKDDMENLQLEQLKQKIQQQRLQQGALNNYFNSMTGDGTQPVLSDGNISGAASQSPNNLQSNGMPSNSAPNAGNLKMLQALAASGYDTKNLFDMYKYGTDGVKRDAGAYYKNPMTGGTEYIADPTKGITIGKDGQVIAMPGAADAMASIEGAKTNAQENAKANYDILDPSKFVLSNGSPFVGTRKDFINQNSPQPSAPNNIDTSGASGLDISKLSVQQLQFLQKQDPAAFNEGVTHFAQTSKLLPTPQNNLNYPAQNSTPQGSGFLQSEADKVRSIDTIKANIDVEKQRQLDAQAAFVKADNLHSKLTSAIPMARDYLQSATGSGLGSARDSILGFGGKATNSSNAADQLDVLSGWMVANVPRMEGPQSDKDVLNYKIMAGMVGDRTKPNESRLAALDTLEKLQNKYQDLNVAARGVQGNSPAQTTPKWAGQGYKNEQEVIQDARNAMLRNPQAKTEIIRRLEDSGITNHGLK